MFIKRLHVTMTKRGYLVFVRFFRRFPYFLLHDIIIISVCSVCTRKWNLIYNNIHALFFLHQIDEKKWRKIFRIVTLARVMIIYTMYKYIRINKRKKDVWVCFCSAAVAAAVCECVYRWHLQHHNKRVTFFLHHIDT